MADYLEIIPGTIKTRELHQYLLSSVAPRPIAFASTVNADGSPNLAPFSFFNAFSAKPPILVFSPARRVRDNTTKHTLENIYRVPEVVINMVSYDMVEQQNLASTDYAEGVNEFVKAGFTQVKSDLVRPFRVAEAPVQIECKVREIKPLSDDAGAGNLIICEVLKMHIHRNILNESNMIDPQKIDLVGRMGANYYARASGDAVFEVEKPLQKLGIGIDALPETIRNSAVLTGNDLGRLGNTEILPSEAEVSAFKSGEGAEMLSQAKTKDELHGLAQTLLRAGNKESAFKLLLAGAQLS